MTYIYVDSGERVNKPVEMVSNAVGWEGGVGRGVGWQREVGVTGGWDGRGGGGCLYVCC